MATSVRDGTDASSSATTTRSSVRRSRPAWPSSHVLDIVGEAEDGQRRRRRRRGARARRPDHRRRAAQARRHRGDPGSAQGSAADQGHHLHRPRPARPARPGAARRRLRLRAQVGARPRTSPGPSSRSPAAAPSSAATSPAAAVGGGETARPLAPRAPDPRAARRGAEGEEIAERLQLSPATVHTHVRNAIAKLEVDTRTEAVALAVRFSYLGAGGGARVALTPPCRESGRSR